MIFKCKARQAIYKIKSKNFVFILFVYITLNLNACTYKVRYPYEFPSKTFISFEENYWFWGLIGGNNYEVYNICPGGRIFEIIIDSSFTQSTISILTLGIYSSRTITIVCSIRGN